MCPLYQIFDSNNIAKLEHYTQIVEIEGVITMD